MARPGARVLLVTLALVATSVLASAATAPEYSAGDRWRYDEIRASGNATVSRTVLSIEQGNATIETTTFENATVGSNPVTNEPIVRSSWIVVKRTLRLNDSALLREELRMGETVGGVSGSAPVTRTRAFDTPCTLWRWPLEIGANWTVTCAFTETGTAAPTPTPGTFERRYAVTERADVTVPAGTFGAFLVVNMTGGTARDGQWFAPEACGSVRDVRFEGGERRTVRELVEPAAPCRRPGEMPPPPPEVVPEEPEEEEETPPPPPPPEPEEETPTPEPEPESNRWLPATGTLAALAGALAAAGLLARRRR